jgi:hypothetical protein
MYIIKCLFYLMDGDFNAISQARSLNDSANENFNLSQQVDFRNYVLL